MSKSFKISIIILLLAVISFGSYILVKNKIVNLPNNFSNFGNKTQNQEPALEDLTEKKDLSKSREFLSSEFGFSINLPPGVDISDFPDSSGYMYLISQASQGSFAQIYITEFDETAELTLQRILKDIRDKQILNGKVLLLDGKKVMSFDSEADGFGKTWEVWFVNNGYLFQIMTKAENRDKLENILTTWKFK